MDREISAYLLKLRREHPFLATLSLYMDYQFTDQVERFDTDGRKTRINPGYFQQLDAEQRIGMLLHVTLHGALLHPVRRGARLLPVWNIAADVVVNEIVAESRFKLPPETAVEPRYAGLSVEQVYARLLAIAGTLTRPSPSAAGPDSPLRTRAQATSACTQPAGADPQRLGANGETVAAVQKLYPATADLREPARAGQPNAGAARKRLEGYWKRALIQAQTVEQISGKSRGELPLGLLRAIDQVLHPQLDWRTLLWRFMTRTPCDYAGFDRRFAYQGLYLDQLEGETLNVHIAMDTSGSISGDELAQFRAEVEAIVRCYGTIDAQLYFVDADVYGPYPITAVNRIVSAEGGGGTDFSVFFAQLESRLAPFEPALCVYLTDGLGEFPPAPPSLPVLWVVSSGGSELFPFGEVAYLTR